jgi:hypothetical protein
MNPFEMVVLIVAIVMIAGVVKAKYGHSGRGDWRVDPLKVNLMGEGTDSAETKRLREEVADLKERIKVLERITVEKENSLARQIDELRDR